MSFHPCLAAYLALLVLPLSPLLGADAKPALAEATTPDAVKRLPDTEDAAWQMVQESTKPPLPPGEWNQKKPTEEEFAAFRLKMGQSAATAADRAKEFAVRFPESTHAKDAGEVRLQMLRAAVQLGVRDREAELASVSPGRASGSSPADTEPAEGPFEEKMKAVVEGAMQQQSKGMDAVLREFEKGIRGLMKEFPERPELYMALLEVANGSDAEHARELGKEIRDSSKAPEQAREMATALVKKYDRVGQPLDIKFKAVDGREVSIAALKGKVILVDFWATWCGPCVAEIPNVKAAYAKLNPQGFEILGISFDQEKETLESFVKKKGMTWPQYFDGEGWQNKFGQEFGISGIPSMWLVDKEGKLRDMNGREDLVGKVEKLLAEK